jgi:anti-sigma B factor antagonist
VPATTAVSHGPHGPVVRISGAFDVASSRGVHDVLAGLLDDGHPSLTLDLGSVHFMDSTGMRTLNVARKRTDAAGGGITLRHTGREVRRVIELLGMTSYFTFVDD